MEFNLEKIKANGGRCLTRGDEGKGIKSRKVRIQFRNHKLYPIVGFIEEDNGEEELAVYSINGQNNINCESSYDLVCEPESKEIEVYLCYEKYHGYYSSLHRSDDCVGSKRITITEGEFADE